MASMPNQADILARMEQRDAAAVASQAVSSPTDSQQASPTSSTATSSHPQDSGEHRGESTGSDSSKKPYGQEPQAAKPQGEGSASQGANAQAQPELDESGHPVPYGRFKSVLSARNEFRSKLDKTQAEIQARDARIQELEQRLASGNSHGQPTQQKAAKDPVDAWVDNMLGDEHAPSQEQPWAREMQGTKSELHELKTYIEGQKLATELADVLEKFPGVPKTYLLQEVVKNHKVDLHDLAERYSSGYVGLREKIISEYLATNPQAQAPKPVFDAPPVPPSLKSASGQVAPNLNSGTAKPRTMAEARAKAMARFGITEKIPG